MGRFWSIDGRACWFWAFLLLTLPLDWLGAAALAAAVHELCHVLAVYLCGGKLLSAKIGPFGAVLETHSLSPWGECVSALAGPAGSFLLLTLAHSLPLLAICGLLQGLFNLLPIYPLDGGRALGCLLERFYTGDAYRILSIVSTVVLVLLLLCAVLFCRQLLILPLLLLIRKDILRKRP